MVRSYSIGRWHCYALDELHFGAIVLCAARTTREGRVGRRTSYVPFECESTRFADPSKCHAQVSWLDFDWVLNCVPIILMFFIYVLQTKNRSTQDPYVPNAAHAGSLQLLRPAECLDSCDERGSGGAAERSDRSNTKCENIVCPENISFEHWLIFDYRRRSAWLPNLSIFRSTRKWDVRDNWHACFCVQVSNRFISIMLFFVYTELIILKNTLQVHWLIVSTIPVPSTILVYIINHSAIYHTSICWWINCLLGRM